MNGFPTEFPSLAIRQVLNFINKVDTDKGRLALALYQITGFGLGRAFGEVNYLMQDTPSVPPTDEEVKALTTFIQAGNIQGIFNQGIPEWMIPLIIQAIQFAVEKWLKPK